jgi:hypothetical protein
MERSRWTDERIDDLAGGMRDGFDRVDRRFDQVDNRFDGVDRRFEQVHTELRELRQWMIRLTMGMSLGFVSVLAAILARGA